MAKRDPELTARNRIDEEMSLELKRLLPVVLQVTGCANVHSLHGKIGGKYAEYLDIKHVVISSADEFVQSWLDGYKAALGNGHGTGAIYDTYEQLRKHKVFFDYLVLFLKRTYLRNNNALSKKNGR
jgi:hypothetical protein